MTLAPSVPLHPDGYSLRADIAAVERAYPRWTVGLSVDFMHIAATRPHTSREHAAALAAYGTGAPDHITLTAPTTDLMRYAIALHEHQAQLADLRWTA